VRAFYQVCDLKNYFRLLALTQSKVLLKDEIAPAFDSAQMESKPDSTSFYI